MMSFNDQANPPPTGDPYAVLRHELHEAEVKAWDSLSRYKFQMFGYWAAIWVHLNRIGNFKKPNPWKSIVKVAREKAA
jgi:hypothetical protein